MAIVVVAMCFTVGAQAAGVPANPLPLFGGSAIALTGLSLVAPALPGVAFSALTCGELAVVEGKMAQLWSGAQPDREYVPNSAVLQAIIANQTATIDPLVGLQDKDNKMKITFIKSCPSDPEDKTSDCMPDGDEDTIDCKEYEPTILKQLPFKVNENTFRTSTYTKEELIAKGLAKRLKLMDEMLAAQAVAFLEDSEGVSLGNWVGDLGTLEGTGTVGDSYIKVAPAYWTADLMGYLTTLAQMNKFPSPFLISGANLQAVKWNAEMSAANADGKGDFNKISSLPMVNDPWNIDSAFSYPTTFLINKGALAFGSKWRYGNTPTDMGGDIGKRWSTPSPTLPGVRYDIYYKVECSGDDQIYHKFNIIARAGFYLNPVGCVSDNTGILRVHKKA